MMKCEFLEVELEVPQRLMPPGEPLVRLRAVMVLLGKALVEQGIAVYKIKFKEEKGDST